MVSPVFGVKCLLHKKSLSREFLLFCCMWQKVADARIPLLTLVRMFGSNEGREGGKGILRIAGKRVLLTRMTSSLVQYRVAPWTRSNGFQTTCMNFAQKLVNKLEFSPFDMFLNSLCFRFHPLRRLLLKVPFWYHLSEYSAHRKARQGPTVYSIIADLRSKVKEADITTGMGSQ